MTLTLTSAAVGAIRGLATVGDADGVRISTARASLNGRQASLQVTPAARPEPQDTIVEAEGARLFLAPGTLSALDGKLLDADVEGGEVQFALVEQPHKA